MAYVICHVTYCLLPCNMLMRYTLYVIRYTIRSTWYHCTLYSAQFVFCIIHDTLYIIHLYSVLYTCHTTHYTLYPIPYTLCMIHCTCRQRHSVTILCIFVLSSCAIGRILYVAHCMLRVALTCNLLLRIFVFCNL